MKIIATALLLPTHNRIFQACIYKGSSDYTRASVNTNNNLVGGVMMLRNIELTTVQNVALAGSFSIINEPY